jgi:hypothetical protein
MNTNTYGQMVLWNQNGGTNASSDYVVQADDGTDTQYYGDVGMNSHGFTIGPAPKGSHTFYLWGVGTNGNLATDPNPVNMMIGTSGTNTSVYFSVGNGGAATNVSIASNGVSLLQGQFYGNGGGVSNISSTSITGTLTNNTTATNILSGPSVVGNIPLSSMPTGVLTNTITEIGPFTSMSGLTIGAAAGGSMLFFQSSAIQINQNILWWGNFNMTGPSGGIFFYGSVTGNSMSSPTVNFRTNTASVFALTNDPVPGAWVAGPPQRFDVTVPVSHTLSATISTQDAIIVSNADWTTAGVTKSQFTTYRTPYYAPITGVLNTVTNTAWTKVVSPNSLWTLTNLVGGTCSVVLENGTMVNKD